MTSLKIIIPTAEQKTAADPNRSVWVSANAGSGKTHVLVDRVIRLMLAGAPPQTILCLTFTKAAAAEMQNRLFERLSLWTLASDADLAQQLSVLGCETAQETLDAARRLFTLALETPGGLKIQTIHAFAERLLQLFPVEAGIAPGFTVLDDRDADDLLAEARREALRLAQSDPESELGHSLSLVQQYTNAEQFDQLLKAVFKQQGVVRELLRGGHGFALIRAFAARSLGLDPHQSTNDVRQEINAIDKLAYEQEIDFLKNVEPFKKLDLVRHLTRIALSPDSTYDVVVEKFVTTERKIRSDYASKETKRLRPWLVGEFARFSDLMILHDMHQRADLTAGLLCLSDTIHSAYERRKRQAGAYDFSDLIGRTQAMLANPEVAAWVLKKLDAGLSHILVDEAQDTSPDQWRIIRAIADEFFAGMGQTHYTPRTLFVVGDQKQSIYSFQGADAKAFELVRSSIATQVVNAQQPRPQVSLLVSYRSVPQVLSFVDAVFPGKAYGTMGIQEPPDDIRLHYTNREKAKGIVEIWPIEKTEQGPEFDPWTKPIDAESDESHRKRLARNIALTIKSWIGNRNLAGSDERVKAAHVLILLQRRGALFTAIIAALRAANVPVAGADRLKLLESIAVQDLLALAQFMVLPGDDYSLAAILKSPFVPHPITEEDLLDLAHGRDAMTLHERLLRSANPLLTANASYLEHLRNTVASRGPHALFSTVLFSYRKAMLARLGDEARDATDALVDIAIDYEMEKGASLAGFAAWFQTGESEIKREMEKSSDQVRLMTVHGAKGLEAEIVILADAADMPKKDQTGLFLADNDLPVWSPRKLVQSDLIKRLKDGKNQRALEEHKRLLYVALTRAKDELYIAASLTAEESDNGRSKLNENSWYAFIQDQLEGNSDIELRDVGNGIRRYGADPVFIEDVAEQQSKADDADLPPWIGTALPAQPARTHRSVTSLVYKSKDQGPRTMTPAAAYGIAIHAFLRYMPAEPGDARRDYANAAARRLGIDSSEAQSLADRVSQPDLQPYFAERGFTEVELLGSHAGSETLIGRIDRLRLTEDAIYLIDYKTDQLPPPELTANHPYVQQIAVYSQCVTDSHPGLPHHVALYWTRTGRVDVLPPGLLTRACELALAAAPADEP